MELWMCETTGSIANVNEDSKLNVYEFAQLTQKASQYHPERHWTNLVNFYNELAFLSALTTILRLAMKIFQIN